MGLSIIVNVMKSPSAAKYAASQLEEAKKQNLMQPATLFIAPAIKMHLFVWRVANP